MILIIGIFPLLSDIHNAPIIFHSANNAIGARVFTDEFVKQKELALHLRLFSYIIRRWGEINCFVIGGE